MERFFPLTVVGCLHLFLKVDRDSPFLMQSDGEDHSTIEGQ